MILMDETVKQVKGRRGEHNKAWDFANNSYSDEVRNGTESGKDKISV